jgi:hypothetical protein
MILASAVALAAVSGAAGSVIRGVGSVRAELTFTRAGYEYHALRLSITRAGVTWASGSLGASYLERPKLSVRDLDADGEPEVWVDTYTGGAHCCDESRFFRYVPSRNGYAKTFHGWGNASYRAINLDGRDGVELDSRDDRFAYVFTSFAGSFFPLRIWHFDRGRLRDVTRLFPGLVEHDATELWRTHETFRREGTDVRGVLAAWLADEYLIGREESGWAALDLAYRRGELGPSKELAGWPQGTSYLRALKAHLRKLGYAG